MRNPLFSTLPFLVLSFAFAFAQDDSDQGPTAPDATTKKPQVERISETKYQVGKVTLNTQNKEISFPGKINMTEGLLEYLIVMPHGKMHESLIVSEANPFNINVALKLLSIPAIPRYFPELDENFTPIPAPPVEEAKLAASRLEAFISWKEDDQTVSHPLNALVKNNQDDKIMPAGRWLYTGSVIESGNFIATQTGDILAILNNRASLLNYNGPGSDNDEIWIPVTEKIPQIGTDLTITLKPVTRKISK